MTRRRPRTPAFLAAATLLLLASFASRAGRLLSFPMDIDEIWPIWQSFGDLPHVLGWVPYDWPPLHYVAVWLWRGLIGPDPLTMRLMSVFLFLIGAAAMSRLGTRLARDWRAGIIAAAAYGAFGFSVYLSMLVRGYIVLYALTPLLLWATVRLFQLPAGPRFRVRLLRRGVLAGALIAAMFYTHLTAVIIFAAVGLATLIVYPRRLLRWAIAIGVATVLCAPLIAARLGVAVGRIGAVGQVTTPPFTEAIGGWYAGFFGTAAVVWIGLLIVCTALAWVASPRDRRLVTTLVIWALLPIAVWAVNRAIGFFSLRHLAWVGVGAALLIGFGAARLLQLRQRAIGRVSALAIAGLVVGAMWLPFPAAQYVLYGTPPTLDIFTWLRGQWQAGDVIYLDPTTHPGAPEMWDYFARAYFPGGLPFVSAPGGYRRVWYVTVDGRNTPETRALISAGRVARQFVGPWDFLVRLYEAPPDPIGTLYANGMRFHGLTRAGAPTPGYLVAHENERLTFDVWWSVDKPLSADYSLALQILDKNGALLAQTPDRTGSAETPRETSRWEPGRLYTETMSLDLPANTYQPGDFATKDYTLVLVVYQWWDQARVAAPGVDPQMLLPLGTLHITAW